MSTNDTLWGIVLNMYLSILMNDVVRMRDVIKLETQAKCVPSSNFCYGMWFILAVYGKLDCKLEQCDSSSSLLPHFAFVIDKCPVSQMVGLKGEAMNLVSPDSISSVEWMQGSLAIQKQQPSLVLGFLLGLKYCRCS
ncbi:hypothetical protein ACFE04_020476 [Oxalis oulophora]